MKKGPRQERSLGQYRKDRIGWDRIGIAARKQQHRQRMPIWVINRLSVRRLHPGLCVLGRGRATHPPTYTVTTTNERASEAQAGTRDYYGPTQCKIPYCARVGGSGNKQ